jgi:hypothetical protein
MRAASTAFTTIALALSAAAFTTSAAEAQTRRQPLSVTVQPRSFLDAGRVVPVDHMNRHLSVMNQMTSPSAVIDVTNSFGRSNLPPRIGGGENPFANSFYGPRGR